MANFKICLEIIHLIISFTAHIKSKKEPFFNNYVRISLQFQIKNVHKTTNFTFTETSGKLSSNYILWKCKAKLKNNACNLKLPKNT